MNLGPIDKKQAESIAGHIEKLNACRIANAGLHSEVAHWLSDLGDVMWERLAKAGLVEPRSSQLLGAFIDQFEAQRDANPKIKASSIKAGAVTRKHLREFFGPTKLLQSITEGDADRWFVAACDGRSENTARKWAANAKCVLNAAVRDRLIDRNPFAALKTQAIPNEARNYYITPQEAGKVLDACPNLQWRLIFALARWGGLRCPSEVLALTWDDVLWGENRFNVRSSKTEHHDRHRSRMVPLFPELRPHLDEAFANAKPGALHVVEKTRDPKNNLRSQMTRIIERAGMEPWPKLFQNLRSTRSTEITKQWGAALESKWIGHSQRVADRHYFQVTDEDFNRASEPEAAQESRPYLDQQATAERCTGEQASA